MNPYIVLCFYSVLIIASSILGGLIPSFVRMTHVRMQSILSLVGGFMLGVALLHMVPHGWAACNDLDLVMGCTLLGLIFTFLMIRTLHFHQHGPTAHDSHDHDPDSCDHHSHKHSISWAGVAFGLGIHTIMDGVAVGAAVFSEAGHNHGILPGLAVFVAVLLHKPLDALSITSVMASGGISAKKRNVINVIVAVMCPLGAFMVAALTVNTPFGARALGVLLGLSAGAFLCISLSDLLPEVQFHTHDRGWLSAALLLGVLLAYMIGLLESEHAHHHNHGSPGIHATDDHTGHDHTGQIEKSDQHDHGDAEHQH